MGEGVQARIVSQDDLERMGVHLPDNPDVDLPTASRHELPLLDDDASVCTTISTSGLSGWKSHGYVLNYVDNVDAITHFAPSDPWGFSGIENDPVTVRLASGATYTWHRNWVTGGGPQATQYRKTGNIIFPADDAGNLLLNETNTPNLVWIDDFILALTKRAAAERLMFAQLVYSFSVAVSALGHASVGDIQTHIEQLDRILEEMKNQ